MAKLCINQCPAHKCWSISLEDDEGLGVRLTPDKCCGRWNEQRSWRLSISSLRDMVRACEDAIDDAERAEA